MKKSLSENYALTNRLFIGQINYLSEIDGSDVFMPERIGRMTHLVQTKLGRIPEKRILSDI